MAEQTSYYFIGIKGSGMSALALILHSLGYQVSGSDITEYTFTQQKLEEAGIKILPFNADNIHAGMTIIAGNSFTEVNNPEIARAMALKIPFMRYHEFLGKFMQNYISMGVAGAHGKTSTTSLLAHVMSGVAKTSYLIGDGNGKGVKDAKFFVFEADEYRRRFLAYAPDYMIMTNIDFDHPDYYHDINDVFDAFQSEANQVKKAIFAWGDDPNLRKLTAKVPIYYYGTSDRDDFQARNIVRTTEGSEFDVYHHGKDLGHYQIKLFGEHNILNSLAVIAVSYMENINHDEVARELLTFKGAKRRFNQTKLADMTLIDDYAHHPSEIKATLDAARQEYPDKEIIAVFQPHTYSRTKAYLNDFANILSKADHTYVTPIFSSARENSGDVSSEDLVAKIPGAKVIDCDNIDQLLGQYHDAVVVFMGAGDIQKYERVYQDYLKNK